MKAVMVVLSALTAFSVSGGGVVLGVLASGYTLNRNTWITAIITGIVMAGKDTRSLLQLPPVNGGSPIVPNEKTNP